MTDKEKEERLEAALKVPPEIIGDPLEIIALLAEEVRELRLMNSILEDEAQYGESL